MKEKLVALWKKIKSNMDRSVLIFFCVLFALMALIYMNEINSTPPPFEEITPQPLPKLLPSANYDKIVSFMVAQSSQNLELDKDEVYAIIGKFNMFDVKTVKDAETLEKEANEKMKKTRAAFTEGRYQEAKQLVNEILAVMPSHLEANSLRQQIQEKLNPTLEPTPAPPPAVPDGTGALGPQF